MKERSRLNLRVLSESEAKSLIGTENKDPEQKQRQREHVQALFKQSEKKSTPETHEEKERVLHAAFRYYQMTNFNTDLHRELADAIENGDEEKASRLEPALQKQNLRIFKETIVALGYGRVLSDVIEEGAVAGNRPYSLDSNPFLHFAHKQKYFRWDFSRKIEIETDGFHNHTIEGIFSVSQKELGITDEEMANVREIDLSPEEKNKIQRLKAAVGGYQAELKQVTPKEVAGENFFYKYTDREYNLMISMMVTAWARAAYDKLGLPMVHRERMLSELKMSGDITL